MTPMPLRKLKSPFVRIFLIPADDPEHHLESLIRHLEKRSDVGKGMIRVVDLGDRRAYRAAVKRLLLEVEGMKVEDQKRFVVRSPEGELQAVRIVEKLTN